MMGCEVFGVLMVLFGLLLARGSFGKQPQACLRTDFAASSVKREGNDHGYLSILFLVPYASSPVMRNALLPGELYLLNGIIEEKIYQDGVDLGFGVLFLDLPADQLYTPYTATCFPQSVQQPNVL